MRCSTLVIASFLALAACGREAELPPEPAYLPPEIREQREREVAQAEALEQAMTGPTWRVTEISGEALTSAEATLTFSGDGNVTGTTGCNSITGTYTRDASQISFGPLATTRMLCPQPIMAQERLVLERLNTTIMAGLGEDGTLFLSSLEGDTLTLERAPE